MAKRELPYDKINFDSVDQQCTEADLIMFPSYIDYFVDVADTSVKIEEFKSHYWKSLKKGDVIKKIHLKYPKKHSKILNKKIKSIQKSIKLDMG